MPQAGDVIPYWYLWWREREAGEESGRKLRPCVVLVVVVKAGDNRSKVAVLPITHSPPAKGDAVVALPDRIKRQLGLDDKPSWIVCDEFNEFSWPGYDLGSTPDGQEKFGRLPASLFAKVRDVAIEALRAGRARAVSRD